MISQHFLDYASILSKMTCVQSSFDINAFHTTTTVNLNWTISPPEIRSGLKLKLFKNDGDITFNVRRHLPSGWKNLGTSAKDFNRVIKHDPRLKWLRIIELSVTGIHYLYFSPKMDIGLHIVTVAPSDAQSQQCW